MYVELSRNSLDIFLYTFGGTIQEGLDVMYEELTNNSLYMFLYTSKRTSTQILESQQCSVFNVKNGPFGKKSELFY